MLVSPGQRSRLLISTFPDWAGFAEWYGRISKLADEVTPEIAAKAKELTKEAKGRPGEGAGALQLRDPAALRGGAAGGQFVPAPCGGERACRTSIGDCKDKANLFNTLLRSVGIEAHLVLVPRFSQAHEGIPGLSFNHAISRVTLGGETVWVDTTDDVCRFGMLPPGDPGRKVLVIDGGTNALTQLPAPDPREHVLKVRGEVDCSGPMDALPVKLNATAPGVSGLRAAHDGAGGEGARLDAAAAGGEVSSGGRVLCAGEPKRDLGGRAQ